MRIDVVFEANDKDLQVSFEDKLQLISSGILNDADKVVDGTVSGRYESGAVTSLRGFAFESCKSLTGVSLPNCKSVGNICFRNCTALESVNLPSCEKFSGSSQFDGAVKLKSINVPNLTTIESGQRVFAGCDVLEEFNAPNLTSLTNTAAMFNSCSSLRKVSFPKLGGTTINANTFNWCTHLSALILGGNELNPLENVSAFGNAGIFSGGFIVYVPYALVDTYKTATNWSAFADQIKPISELGE